MPLAHITLATREVQASLAFFAGALGCVMQPGRSEVAAAPEIFRKSRRVNPLMIVSYLALCSEKYAASASICSSV